MIVEVIGIHQLAYKSRISQFSKLVKAMS